MKTDGSNRSKVVEEPIETLKGVSPDKDWAVVMKPVNEMPSTAVFALPLRGGPARLVCPGECLAEWSPDGTRFYVQPLLQDTRGKTVVLAVPAGQSLPELPSSGIRSAADAAALAEARWSICRGLGPHTGRAPLRPAQPTPTPTRELLPIGISSRFACRNRSDTSRRVHLAIGGHAQLPTLAGKG